MLGWPRPHENLVSGLLFSLGGGSGLGPSYFLRLFSTAVPCLFDFSNSPKLGATYGETSAELVVVVV